MWGLHAGMNQDCEALPIKGGVRQSVCVWVFCILHVLGETDTLPSTRQ